MATKIYVYDESTRTMAENIASALQPLVERGWYNEISYHTDSSEIDSIIFKKDNIILAQLDVLETSITFTANVRLAGLLTSQISNTSPCFVYICSGGAYIDFTGDSGKFTGLFISITNRNKPGFLITNTSSGTSAAGRLTYKSISYDDARDFNTGIAASFVAPDNRLFSTLITIPTNSRMDFPSYLINIFYTFTSSIPYINNQSSPPVNVTINGQRYMWVGYYLIIDDLNE